MASADRDFLYEGYFNVGIAMIDSDVLDNDHEKRVNVSEGIEKIKRLSQMLLVY